MYSNRYFGEEKEVIFQFFIMNDHKIRTQKEQMKELINSRKKINEEDL